MEFVTIGNPGNADDTTGNPVLAGSVAYEYRMGKFEVSRDMITKYNANYGTANSLAITLADMTSVGGNGDNRPATGVSWNEAARFVNWLNTSTGGSAAYNFTTTGVNADITPWKAADVFDFDASNPYRSRRANYVLPSMDEWCKAAYYNPLTSTYSNFPTGSDTAPTAVSGGTTNSLRSRVDRRLFFSGGNIVPLTRRDSLARKGTLVNSAMASSLRRERTINDPSYRGSRNGLRVVCGLE